VITWDTITAQKGGYKHFLLKEIHEQPQAIIDTMRGRILPEESDVWLDEFDEHAAQLNAINRLTLVACGTAWHACLAGKFYLEELARLPVEVDYGSEFRYRKSPLEPHTAILAVSQSGETADTLAALEGGRSRGLPTLAICNVVDSSIPRKADLVLYTHAGPEISVASTKAFTTQLTALYLLSVYLGRRRGTIDQEQGRRLLADLVNLPAQVREILSKEKTLEKIAKKYGHAKDFLYLGRGVNYPIALEGALKLKEISYIHAEGYPAGEMKHGPIALIDEEMPVVVLLPKDPVYAKTLSNMKEVEARGGRIIAITDSPSQELEDIAWEVIQVPTTNHLLMPILLTIPMQLLAYHIAVYRGTDVDQPRNLAKSVTVE
jgi:glucosamine--fructose-6-phosphate aminotransferase (isomerizing)